MANLNNVVDSLTTQLQNTSIPQRMGISFAGKGLKLDKAQDAKPIVDEINSSDVVEFLNMEGNSLGVDAAQEIAKALENRKEFKKALWKDMFTSRLKTEIPVALKHLTGSLMLAGARIEILDLSDNASGPIGVEGFEEFLRSPSCYSLRELRLNNMGLGVTGAKKLASALLELYNNSKNAGQPLKLEVFVAGRNRLENPGATALAQVFQKIGTLKEVSMPQNGIYHVGINALSSAFDENLSLEVINLNDNTITEKGAKSLSEVLSKLSHLKTLDLGDCLLKSQGATLIAQSISSLKKLEYVNLSFNEVKASAGSLILDALSPLAQSLSSLDMNGNQFGASLTELLSFRAKQLNLPLASLSEDEGDDSEHDVEEADDDEEEEEEDIDDEEEDYQEDSESDQPYNIDEDYEDEEEQEETSVIVANSGVSPMRSLMTPTTLSQPIFQQANAVVKFLSCATTDNFNCIPDPKANTIIDDIKARKAGSESYIEELIRSIVAVAGLHSCSDQRVKESVMRTCISLFQNITSCAEKNRTTDVLNNRIPVHFGYIKDEETNKKKVVPERESCLKILHAAISSKCLPQQTINIIAAIEAL